MLKAKNGGGETDQKRSISGIFFRMLEQLPVVAHAEGPMWHGECFVQGTRFEATVMKKNERI